jgi:hypothetical protein
MCKLLPDFPRRVMRYVHRRIAAGASQSTGNIAIHRPVSPVNVADNSFRDFFHHGGMSCHHIGTVSSPLSPSMITSIGSVGQMLYCGRMFRAGCVSRYNRLNYSQVYFCVKRPHMDADLPAAVHRS